MAQFIELDMDQGSDFVFNLTLTEDDGSPKDLTGYVFYSSFSKSYYSSCSISLNTLISSPPTGGVVAISLDAANTADVIPGRYLFDVKQIDNNHTTSRVVEGVLTVNPQVTK